MGLSGKDVLISQIPIIGPMWPLVVKGMPVEAAKTFIPGSAFLILRLECGFMPGKKEQNAMAAKAMPYLKLPDVGIDPRSGSDRSFNAGRSGQSDQARINAAIAKAVARQGKSLAMPSAATPTDERPVAPSGGFGKRQTRTAGRSDQFGKDARRALYSSLVKGSD